MEDGDLAAARVQDIAAACMRLGLTAAGPPRAPLPVKPVEESPPAVTVPTWDREDLDAIAAMFPDLPDPEPASTPAPEPVAPPSRLRVSDIPGRQRARTIRSPQRLTRDERRAGEQLAAPEDVLRPLERGDCQKDPGRPCPWVGCSKHLYLEVNEETGAIKLNFPHLEVDEMGETCSLDVADEGEHTLEQVGALVNLTRERVRQIEVGAGRNKRAGEIADGIEFADLRGSPLAESISPD